MADSVPEAVFFNATTDVARTIAVECVAQYRDHSCVARDYAVVGVASRRGFSPIEMISAKLDRELVTALRRRFPRKEVTIY